MIARISILLLVLTGSIEVRAQKRAQAKQQDLFGILRIEPEWDSIPDFEILALRKGNKLVDSEPKAIDSVSMTRYLKSLVKGQTLYLSQNGHLVGRVHPRNPGQYYPWEIPDVYVSVDVDVARTTTEDTNIVSFITSWEPKPQYGMPRQATEGERAIALTKARSLLMKHKASESALFDGLVVERCQVICDGEFMAASASSIDTIRYVSLNLFVLIDTKSGEPAFVRDGTSNEVEASETIYLGQLDLDKDGVDEIILGSQYGEWTDYTFLKRSGKKWKKVFQGGGSGL